MAAAPSSTAAEPGHVGVITLARHGEPALCRRVRLDAEGYRRWWAAYEVGGLLPGQTPPQCLVDVAARSEVIYSSSLPRSIETAQAVARGRSFSSEAMFAEAPLPPPRLPSFVRLSPRLWGVIARFWWWYLGHHEGQETRQQAQVRAEAAAGRLIAHAEQGHDVLVLAHGFFNAMVGLELKRRGWRCAKDQGFRYWSTRRFECGRVMPPVTSELTDLSAAGLRPPN